MDPGRVAEQHGSPDSFWDTWPPWQSYLAGNVEGFGRRGWGEGTLLILRGVSVASPPGSLSGLGDPCRARLGPYCPPLMGKACVHLPLPPSSSSPQPMGGGLRLWQEAAMGFGACGSGLACPVHSD